MALHVLNIIVSCRDIAVKTILFSVFYYYARQLFNADLLLITYFEDKSQSHNAVVVPCD